MRYQTKYSKHVPFVNFHVQISILARLVCINAHKPIFDGIWQLVNHRIALIQVCQKPTKHPFVRGWWRLK